MMRHSGKAFAADTWRCIGPAHAVYFATYEAVKHAMGGNAGAHGDHHPLAAGKTFGPLASHALMC